MDTQDLSLIQEEIFLPLSQPSNTTATQTFTSPFAGQSPKEIRDWFHTHITWGSTDLLSSWTREVFIILDKQTLLDESTCLFVCTRDWDKDPDQPIEKMSLRCDFYTPLDTAIGIEHSLELFEDMLEAHFGQEDVVMTGERFNLALHRGLYIAEGEVKRDEYWANFGK